MAASVQFRPQNRDLGMAMREVDEDLAIFLGMRNGEKQWNDHLLDEESDEFDDSKGVELKPDSLLVLNASQAEIVPIAADENFLSLEIERSDYNWFLKQPDSSLLPTAEVDSQDSAPIQTEISNGEGISLKSELENACEESAPLSDTSLQLATPTSANSSAALARRPLSAGDRKTTPRAAALPAKSRPSRASTPTSRATLASSKATGDQRRSSTPARATSRSSTPASRPSVPVVSKSGSRSATPTRKPATSSATSSGSASDNSSSGRKTGSKVWKSALPSRGTSPTVKPRPSKPSEMLSSSQDSSQNLKASMPKRPASASRSRPSPPSTSHPSSNGKPRQKSCSPAKVRAPITTANKTGSKMLSRSRGYSNGGDDVNPVLMGTKMVDRVVNMRKLAPPKHDEFTSHENPRKSAQENSGFGRSLSKKSLDMAIRHMDIRRRVPDKLRPVAKGILSSAKDTADGVSESPPTPSSFDGSKSTSCIM